MTLARRLLLILLLLILIGGTLLMFGRRYLASQHAAQQVASRLQNAYGGPVELESVDVGLGNSSVRRLRLFESGPDAPPAPWIEVEDLDADVSLWSLLRGEAMPENLGLRGAAVTLRFDTEGHLLTKLPQPTGAAETLPTIHVDHGQITLRQTGRADMVIHGADIALHPTPDGLVLSGTVADPFWGNWNANGSLDPATGANALTLKTERVHITQPMLTALPFVSAAVWREVQLEGDSPVTFTLRTDAGATGVHYRVDLDPEATTVDVRAIDLHAEQAHGKVIVEDGIVRLRDVRGQAAKGEIETSGDLDFHTSPDRLQFNVKVSRLALDSLPKSWKIPPAINGRLTGQAKLLVTIADGKVHTDGEGEGVVNEARLVLPNMTLPSKRPITLKLHAAEGTFKFTQQNPAVGLGPVQDAAALAVLMMGPAEERDDSLLDELTAFPSLAVKWLGLGLDKTTQAVAGAGKRLRTFLPNKPGEPASPPTYLEVNLALDDVDLRQLVEGLKIQTPFSIAGRASFDLHVALPINTPGELKAYRLKGTANLKWFKLEGLEMEQVRARVDYANGVLRLEELRGRVPAETLPTAESASGTFNGTAQLQLFPQGDLTAGLTLDHIPLQRVLTLVAGTAQRAEGTFSGTVSARAAAARLGQPAAWEATGNVHAERVRTYGLTVEDAAADIRLKEGLLTLSQARARIEGAPLTGSADLRLSDSYRYEAKVDLRNSDLSALQRLSPGVRPPVALAGRFDGTADLKGMLSPFTVNASGDGTATELRVEGVKVARLKFHWDVTPDRVALTDVRTDLYGGAVTGTASIPLRAAVPGKVDLRFKDVDVAGLSKDVPAMPVRLEGRAAGSVEGTLPAAAPGKEREFTGKVELEAPRLRVQGIPADRIRGTVESSKGHIDYRIEGDTLGGKFNLNGRVPPAEPKPGEPPAEGHLRIEGAQLRRLWPELDRQSALIPLRGVVEVSLDFRHDGPGGSAVGTGRFTLNRLRWDDTDLAGNVTGSLRLADQQLRLRDLSGTVGQGIVRSQVNLSLRPGGRNWFTLDVDNVEASRLVAAWPALAGRVRGPLSAHLRGTLGQEWRGSGEITLSQGKFLDVDIAEWRLPIDFAFAPGGRAQVEVRDSSGQVAQGRVTGSASLGWGLGTHTEGHVRFFGVQLQTMLRQLTDSGQVGAGQMNGRFDFSGNDVRSLNDLQGTLEATLQQTQAFQMPVLSQLAPYITPGQSSGTFRSGDVRARLGGGIWRIERLTLEGTTVQVFAEGTVSLQGRLALTVMANTGHVGPDPQILRLLGLRLPVAGPVPVALLLQASNYLSNRVVHLRVSGTVRSPTVTVEPLPLLTDEAARYFLNRYNLPASGSPLR